MTAVELAAILKEALAAEFGVEVKTDNPAAFQRSFYSFRKLAKEDDNMIYNNITCRIMSDSIIHLVNRGDQHGKAGL